MAHRSPWNVSIDRLLAAKLTGEELRLALAIMRYTIGWRKTGGNRIGRRYLCEKSGLDARNLARARRGLIEKGLLHYEEGEGGRGNRSFYRLLLDSEKLCP